MGNKERLQLILVFKGAILKKMRPGLIVVAALTSSLAILHFNSKELQSFNLTISAALPEYMGAAIGLLLV